MGLWLSQERQTVKWISHNHSFELRLVPKVQEQTHSASGHLEVVQELCFGVGFDLGHAFDFDQNGSIHDQVGEELSDAVPAKVDFELRFLEDAQSCCSEDDRESATENLLREAMPKLAVSLEERRQDPIGRQRAPFCVAVSAL